MSEQEQEWTKEVPTEKGYYWIYDTERKRNKSALVWFENEGMIRIFGGAWLGVSNFGKDVLWSRRVEMPQLPAEYQES